MLFMYTQCKPLSNLSSWLLPLIAGHCAWGVGLIDLQPYQPQIQMGSLTDRVGTQLAMLLKWVEETCFSTSKAVCMGTAT